MPRSRSDRRSFRRVGVWLLLLITSCAGLTCSAQEIIFHLKNGDRITGAITAETTNGVTIATSYGGRLVLPVAEIERREPKPPELPPMAPAPAAGALASPPPQQKPPPAEPPAEKLEPPAPVRELREFFADWVGEVRLGMNLGFSTKDRQTYTGRFKATHVDGPMKNILDYSASYGRIEGVLSDNQMDGSWKLEYNVGKNGRFHFYNSVGAGYDEIQEIDFRYDVGPGIGYKWLTLSNLVLQTELGGNYQKQHFTNGEEKTRYALRIGEDLTWQISNKLKLDEKIEFFPQIDNFSDFRLRIEANLSYLLRNNLTLNLTVIDIYDTVAPPGVSNNDLQIRSSLGIKF